MSMNGGRGNSRKGEDVVVTPEENLRLFRRRMLVVTGVLLVLFSIGAYRSFELQVIDRDAMLHEAERNYLRTMIVESRRGDILDRNGEQFATSVRVDTIVANPREVRNPVETARSLSGTLTGIDEKALTQKLKSKSWWEYVKRRVTEEESARVRALKLDGILITQEWKRFYPKKNMLGQVLGRAGMDAKGLDGLEKAMDAHLYPRATPSGSNSSAKPEVVKVPYIKDIRGKKAYVEGLPGDLSPEGASLELTIDSNIQDVTDKALEAGVRAHKGHTGIALVMDVQTGELLAVSNYPFFNPNEPGKTEMYVWKNRAFKDQFEPGSTLKVFSLAAVLEQGKARLDEIIDVENGRLKIGRHWIRDTHRSEKISVKDVIGQSSNVGIVKLTQRIEKGDLLSLLQRLGFGKKTGVESDYEVRGKIQPISAWADITYANISFGQGIAVSAIQLLTAFAAIGNEGKLLRPRLVRRVLSEDGRELVPMSVEVVDKVVSVDVARKVLEAMEAVTGPGGTAQSAAIRGYRVAGKTGTAQKPATGFRRGKKVKEVKKGYADDAWISSFIGMVPADDPRLAILVLVDEPEGRGFGGVVAAPIFHEIATWTLRYLGVPSGEIRPIKVSSVSKTRKDPEAEKPAPIVVEAVIDSAAALPSGDALYVPDLLGRSMASVLKRAREVGLKVQIQGSGRAYKQSLPPGTILPSDGMISVHFRSGSSGPNGSHPTPGGPYAP